MKLKHLKIKGNMSFKEKFLIKWSEEFRKRISYYEPIISLKLFNN